MKFFATGLLAIMAVVFVFTLYLNPALWWTGWLRAFTEAAVIGGLADWFAVSALFRHPLGLPIRHTAVVPRNKERIAAELGAFLETNFLSEEVLRSRLSHFDFAGKAGVLLSDRQIAEKLAGRFSSFAAETLSLIEDRHINSIIRENIGELTRKINLSAAAGGIVELLISGNQKDEVVSFLISKAEHLLGRHQDTLSQLIQNELPWWLPGFVHHRIVDEVIAGLHKTLRGMREDPSHALRQRLASLLDRLVHDLKHDAGYKAGAEKLKSDMLKSDAGMRSLEEVGDRIRQAFLRSSASPDSAFRRSASEVLVFAGQTLCLNQKAAQRINGWFSRIALDLLISYRSELSNIISHTMRQWDAKTISEKIESQVGDDLQFIRVNGTLVGGLIGITIYALTRFLV